MTDSSQPTTTVLNDRYELRSRIARGGMADVFLAQDQLLDRSVAVKMLYPQYASDPAFVKRFRREAQAAANLNHPSIVAVYDWGRHDDTYFIVMEYVQGQTLADLIAERGSLDPAQAVAIASETAAALGFAHKNGTVHRDVKPGNIMLTKTDQVKVADFGIARAFGGVEEDLTQTGSVMGTASYFSPEQAQGKPADPRSDLYSLGIVLFEMLAGETPFLGNTPVAIAYKHVQEPAPLVSSRNPTVPAALDAVVDRLLQKNRDLRYGDAVELQAELRRYRNGEPVHAGANIAGANIAGAAGAAGATIPQQSITSAHAQNGYGQSSEFGAAAQQPQPQQSQPQRSVLGEDPTVAQGAYNGAAGFGGVASGYGDAQATQAMIGVDPTAMHRTGPDSGSSRALIDTTRAVPASAAVNQVEPVEEHYDAPNRTGFMLVLLLGLVALMGIFAFYIINALGGEDTDPNALTIPPVIGMTQEDAVSELEEAGFTNHKFASTEPGNGVEGDRVTRTDPPAGEVAKGDDLIQYYLAATADQELVPPVIGKTEDEAKAALQDLGFVFNIEREDSDTIDEGDVISVAPNVGELANRGATITLTISGGKGSVEIVIPLVRGKSESLAQEDLRKAGFENVSTATLGSVVPEGLAVGTDPENGLMARPDQQITLYISSGPEEVAVPPVVGSNQATALATLESFDLKAEFKFVNVSPGDPNYSLVGRVKKVTPAENTKVLQGDTIVVEIWFDPDLTAPTTGTTATTATTAPTTATTAPTTATTEPTTVTTSTTTSTTSTTEAPEEP